MLNLKYLTNLLRKYYWYEFEKNLQSKKGSLLVCYSVQYLYTVYCTVRSYMYICHTYTVMARAQCTHLRGKKNTA